MCLDEKNKTEIVKCIILRHGKTKGNLEGRYIGRRSDEPLCEEGEALLNSKREFELKDYINATDSVFVSPMRRCVESANILFPLKKFTVIEELAELDFGEFEGKNYHDLNGSKIYQDWIDSGGMSGFPGGEDLNEFSKRCMSGLKKSCAMHLLNDSHDKYFALMCHGGTIMAVLSALTGENYYDFQVKNGEGYLLELQVTKEISDGKAFDISHICLLHRLHIGSDNR